MEEQEVEKALEKLTILCSVGKCESKEGSHSCGGEIISQEELECDDVRLLKIRGCCKKKVKTVCERHHKKLLVSYVSHQKVCCDPFEKHLESKRKRPQARNLKAITLEMRDLGKLRNLLLIPGQKLCVSCSVHFHSLFERKKKTVEETRTEAATEVTDTEATTGVTTSIKTPPKTRADQLNLARILYASPSLPSSSIQGSQQSSVLSTQASLVQENFNDKDVDFPETLDTLNNWLKSVGKNSLSLRQLAASSSYLERAINDIREVLEKYSGRDPSEELSEIVKKAGLYDEMLSQLQDFVDKHKNEKQAQILALSVLPQSLNISKIREQFEVSTRLVKNVKSVVMEKGILSLPEPKQGRKLSEETQQLVCDYFYRMDVSRELPGKKDNISIIENKKRILKRKRLVLGTLSELHEQFLKEYNITISISKFASLRPRECVLAGSPGTHMVCVCTYHQNPKLMFKAADLHKIDGISTVSDCLKFFLCEEPTESCYFRTCEKCPDGFELQEKIELHFAEEMIQEIIYNQWKSTDRSEMETVTSKTEKFLWDFFEQMEELITHSFVADQQATFYRKKLENLEEGEVVVNADFAENYTYVIQDSSQGHYFSNKQATVHPFMIYTLKNGFILKLPFVVLSEYTEKHDTASFSSFQIELVKYLNLELGSIKKIYYFSDGSAAQYKNRKAVANTWFHQKDFGVPAEWHFFATSHGKCACDGLGGTVKRTAYLHSLRATKPEDHITDVSHLFEFCKAKIPSMHFALVTTDQVKEHMKSIEMRFQTAAQIDGIKSSHAIIPSGTSFTILMKAYSNATSGVEKPISTRELQIPFSDVRGFIIYWESNQWKLGYVEEKNEDLETYIVTCLKETSQKFSYEFEEHETNVSHEHLLLLVEPRVFKRGQLYKLLAKDIQAANECLKNWKGGIVKD